MKLFKTLPAAALAIATAFVGPTGTAHADDHSKMSDHGIMHVTKSPTCGCCGAWVDLAREEGYVVEVTDTANVNNAKLNANVPVEMWACHTAKIDGYVVEGHVPFAAIARLLERRPAVTGISVPGMPAGSPGMGDDPNARYNVIAFGGDAGDGKIFYEAGQ